MRTHFALLVTFIAIVAFACSESTTTVDTATTAATTSSTADDGAEVDPARGATLFAGTCEVCHGPGAEGIEGLGKPLVDNEFIQTLSDEELVTFIAEGRPADDQLNTTGIAMPPRGANPSLSDDDLADIGAWLRTLQP